MATSQPVDQDDLKLRESGFDPAAPPEQALETLRTLRGKQHVSEAAIARALGELRIAGAADLLGEMEVHATGAARREIRRSLFRLRQRGFEPSRAATPAERRESPAPPADSNLSALLSPIDPAGERIAWIMKPRTQGGLVRLVGLASETEGLTYTAIDTQSRREVREHRAEIERRFKLKLIEADWRLADFILCEAYRRTPESRRGRVGDFLALRAEITSTPPPADFVHPVYQELLSEPAEPAPELLKEPEILGWHFPPGEIKPYVDEINELKDSPLVLNKLQQQDRIEAIVGKALTNILSGERSERARRRFEDIAYYMARTGRKEPARWAAAAAAAIRDGADLKRIPFFRNFIQMVLGAVLGAEEERAEKEPRLVVTPAEAMRERQSRARPR